MIKIILISSLVSASLVSTTFMAAGRVHYSGLQIQHPIGSAFKMTPDHSNIWSFHETVTIPANSSKKYTVSVKVDFDNNGKMDTEYKELRVSITDMLFLDAGASLQAGTVLIRDDSGPRWVLSRPSSSDLRYVDHLTTPLVLPVDSGLVVEFTASNSSNSSKSVQIHLIGRLVTL